MSFYVRWSGSLNNGGGASGTVTSVALAAPAIFTVSGSPIVTSGTLTLDLANESANLVWAGPSSGGAAAPTFRSLVAADLPTGNLTDAGTDGITVTNGTGAIIGSGTSIAQHVADATHNGYLSSSDWSTFNSKQAALTIGNLTDVGTDGITITGGTGAVIGSGAAISQHVADTTHNGYLSSTDWNTFNGKQGSGNYITALTGDVTASGPGSAAATLATVNSNVGSFGSSTSIPSFTVNGKGLITAANGNVVIAPAGTLTGTTLNSTVVTSSLTSVGTIASGTWNGTTIAIANGGTGQTSANAAFNALSPMTTGGDLIYGGASGVATRLANGSAGQFLSSNGGTAAPSWINGLSNPMSTGGDIIYGGASGIPTRLANGSAGQVLTSSGGTSAPTWGSTGFNYTAQTTTYSAVINDFIVASSSSFTITLPTAVGNSGRQIGIKHNGNLGQYYTLNTTSAQTINGLASGVYELATNGEVLLLFSDGANWQIAQHFASTSFQAFPSLAAGTLITAVTTNPSYGTLSTNAAYWRRNGSVAEIQWDYRATAAGGNGSGMYLLNLPSGITIDTSVYTTNLATGAGGAFADSVVGVFTGGDSNNGQFIGKVAVYSGTQLKADYVLGTTAGGSAAGVWGSGNSGFGSDANLNFHIRASFQATNWQP